MNIGTTITELTWNLWNFLFHKESPTTLNHKIRKKKKLKGSLQQNKRLPGARILNLVKYLLSRAITLTRSCLTFSFKEEFGRTYHKDHFINWKFHFIFNSFQILTENCQKKKSFLPFKGNNSNSSSKNFDPHNLL